MNAASAKPQFGLTHSQSAPEYIGKILLIRAVLSEGGVQIIITFSSNESYGKSYLSPKKSLYSINCKTVHLS